MKKLSKTGMYLYTIYDTKGGVGGTIFMSANDRTARREFEKLFKGDEKTKQEYRLLKLGLYENIVDDEIGVKEIKIFEMETKDITTEEEGKENE